MTDIEAAELAIGTVVGGVVTRLDERGVWVKLFSGPELLLRNETIPTQEGEASTAQLKVGDRVQAEVVRGTWEFDRLLSRRGLLLPTLPAFGAEVVGRVIRVEPYGAFVDVMGHRLLLPNSEMAHEYVAKPEQYVSEGIEVRATLIRGKPPHAYALSIKRSLPPPAIVLNDRLCPGANVSGTVRDLWPNGKGATISVDRLLVDGTYEELSTPALMPLPAGLIASEYVYDARNYLDEGQRVEGRILAGRSASHGEPCLSLKAIPAGQVMRGFAYLGDVYTRGLASLANMAQRENEHWDYIDTPRGGFPILDSYVRHTFAKVSDEGEVRIVDRLAAFNTGLMTDTYEEIFGVFSASVGHRTAWTFKGFRDRSARELAAFHDAIPKPANYVGKNHAHMMYDLDLELQPVSHHIIKERGWRLPPELQGSDVAFVTRHVRAAVEQAIHRVRLNYKTAIPQWYLGRLGLLLPLRLTKDQRRTDVALAVMREQPRSGGAEHYRGSTVLRLDWAYTMARLIARPDPEWLTPVAPIVEDSGGEEQAI